MAHARRLLPAITVAAFLVYGLVRGSLAGPGSAAWRPTPPPADAIRIATWNLRNFPSDGHDREYLRRELADLGASILAVQEVRDAAALERLLPGYAVHLTTKGGRGHQRLGLAFDPERFVLAEPLVEDSRLAPDGAVRPAAVATLRPRAGGKPLSIVVVHLKARPIGHDRRRAQWGALVSLIAEQVAAHPERRLVVLGDFNATGPVGGTPAGERQALRHVLAPSGLQLAQVVGQCTAYWGGVRYDAWYEPSWLDLIWTRGLGSPRAQVAGACARHACVPMRSTDAYPDPDLDRASDHCPVWIDVTEG